MANKSIYTKKLGREVARLAKGSAGIYHVIPLRVNKWSVVTDRGLRTIKVVDSEDEAISFAKGFAQSRQGEVIIHGRDGKTVGVLTF